MATHPTALIIFARAPLAGEVKTRLIPALGAEGAAELYRCFLLDTLAAAAGVEADAIVAAAEEGQVAAVRALAAETCPRAEVIAQEGRDLGERMRNAFRLTLGSGYERAVILGSDAPSLPWERVREALRLAGERDVVLGPCLDGGYYLIGMHAVAPRLFEGIEWGGPTVLAETLRKAQELGLTVAQLEPWYDVDTPQDLERLRAELAEEEGIACPRTWVRLREMGA
jgi:rSAM/selenodomain-associated transferase 1